MRVVLLIFGVIASILSLLAFATALTKGTDLQLIAAGVFGTMSAVCFGFSATLGKMGSPRKETALDLARELLGKWNSMDESTRNRLAKALIGKIDSSISANDLASMDDLRLKERLSSLSIAKA